MKRLRKGLCTLFAALLLWTRCVRSALSQPGIDYTAVPQYGTTQDLYGVVSNVVPTDVMVAGYIKVGDGWWTKPSFLSPLTPVAANNTWNMDVTTGGSDIYATEILVFLLPVGVNPPPCAGCSLKPVIPQALASKWVSRENKLFFRGYWWTIKKRDVLAGPGPNYFSDNAQDVYVDSAGLHLSLVQRNSTWYCTEVSNDTSLGYGVYIVTVHGRVDLIDANSVAGFFTWDYEAPQYAYRELDFEVAPWGNALDPAIFQYAVQPCGVCPGCGRCFRYQVNLTPSEQDLTFILIWEPGRAIFQTYRGSYLTATPPPGALIVQWQFTDASVPPTGGEHFHFNFWLLNGNPPTNGLPDSYVVTGFAWQPPNQVPSLAWNLYE